MPIMKTLKLLSSLRLAGVLLAGLGAAALSSQAANHSSLKHGDKSFVEDAAESGKAGVAISQIAVSRATHPQVREFAQMMVNHHGAANRELMTLASAKGVMLPTKDVDLEKWNKKDASDFDEDYLEKMIDDHEESVEHFEKAAKKADDSEVMAYAAKPLPTLQAHLEQARNIKAGLK